MIASMRKAKAVTQHIGQEFVVFKADQQLYRVAVHILWENKGLFNNFHL
jgi:hypothetical protein